MEKHLELKEKFDQLMKQDMDVSEHEQEWFELLNDMHEYLKDKTIPRNIRRQFEPLGMLEITAGSKFFEVLYAYRINFIAHNVPVLFI